MPRRPTHLTHIQRIVGAYLMIYLIGYRINEGAWPKRRHYDQHDQHKGSLLVSFLTLVALLCAIFAVGDAFGITLVRKPMGLPELALPVVISIAVVALNDHLLIRKGWGIRFEKRFDGLATRDQVWIGLYTVLLVLLCVGGSIAEMQHHRHLIGVD